MTVALASRRSFLVLAVAALSACGAPTAGKPPPTGRFYFPTGLAFARQPGASEGVLYVASSNLDKRYDLGTVIAVDLSKLDPPLPAFPTDAGVAPAAFVANDGGLPIAADGVVYVQSFAGEMGTFPLSDGGIRLFVPSRAEGNPLQTIDAAGPSLSCFFAAPGGGANCFDAAPSLSANEKTATGVPRAPSPFGVGVAPEGTVYVTELDPVDSPTGSVLNLRGYVVEQNALAPDQSIPDESFVQVPTPSSGVAVGSRYLFLSGRFSNRIDFRMVTLVDRTTLEVQQPFLEQAFQVQDARGIALSSDEQRLYVVTRFPDTLVVVDVLGASSAAPVLSVVHSVPMPEGPNEMQILERPGRGDLVAVSCSTSGKLVLYDADVGDLVAQLPSVGAQPFGIAVEPFAVGARLFVSNFADGQVAVVDVPFDEPALSAVVARLGKSQVCIVTPTDASCTGAVP